MATTDFSTRHPNGLGLWQSHFGRILAVRIGERAGSIYRGREVRRFAHDGPGVDAEVSYGTSPRAGYLIGCDGGRGLIRKPASIEVPAWIR